MVPSLPLLSYESSVSVKENPDRKKKKKKIDPLNSSCFQKLRFPERESRLYVIRKSSSLEKVVVSKVALASANFFNHSCKNLLYLMNSCNYSCEIAN